MDVRQVESDGPRDQQQQLDDLDLAGGEGGRRSICRRADDPLGGARLLGPPVNSDNSVAAKFPVELCSPKLGRATGPRALSSVICSHSPYGVGIGCYEYAIWDCLALRTSVSLIQSAHILDQ